MKNENNNQRQDEEFGHELGIYFSVQEMDAKTKWLKKSSSREKKEEKEEESEKKS